MEYYAIPGETNQHICKARHAPEGAVLMLESNPGGYIAQANGTWLKGQDKIKEEALVELDATLELGFSFYGAQYQCREKDMIQWQRGLTLIDLMELTEVSVRAMDNSMHELTADTYKGLCKVAAITYESALRTYWGKVDG